jgi:hypothetical protein
LSFQINLYEISEPAENELLLVEMRSKKLTAIAGILLFGAMGGFFLFLFINSLSQEGFYWSNLFILGGFATFMLGLSIAIFVSSYVTTTSYHFTKSKLTVNTKMKRPKEFARNSVTRIFIQETIIEDSSGLPSGFHYSLMMKMKLSAKPKELLTLENQDKGDPMAKVYMRDNQEYNSNPLFKAFMDEKLYSDTEKQAHQIASIISEFWEIEVKAEQPGSSYL